VKRFTTILAVRNIPLLFEIFIMEVLFGSTSLPVEIVAVVAILVSFFVYILTSSFRKILKKYGVIGTDVHKQNKPKVPESGGIVLAIGFTIFLAFMFLLTHEVKLLYILVTSLLFGFFGFLDDLIKFGKYEKLIFSILISALVLLFSNVYGIKLLLGIPFLIAFTNVFNIFAGLNGLEIGNSTIISFFFMICLFTLGNDMLAFTNFGIFLILLAFLLHNKYPAKIFLGNAGTLLVGSFFASLTLQYDLYFILIPLVSLHIIDCILKGWSAGYFSSSEKKPTKVLKNGILQPRDDFLSFIRLLLRIKPMKEPETVKLIWLLQIIVGVLTAITIGVLL